MFFSSRGAQCGTALLQYLVLPKPKVPMVFKDKDQKDDQPGFGRSGRTPLLHLTLK